MTIGSRAIRERGQYFHNDENELSRPVAQSAGSQQDSVTGGGESIAEKKSFSHQELMAKQAEVRKELIKTMFRKYQEYRTLQKVASDYGYTRERIRQYFAIGNKLGIIDYKPFNRQNFQRIKNELTKDRLIKYLNEMGTIRRISEELNVAVSHVNRLIKLYKLNLSQFRRNYLKTEICKQYYTMVEQLGGKHPSTYDLLLIKNGRNLWAKISRNWGTVKKFREEQHIQLARKSRRRRKNKNLPPAQ
ncbi:MAG: hypothetical protein JW774_01710 [Candidatus Aureabacteria bacterium]|nr:hypothetical protein [Candidatus Auribacterota bacterium]